MRDLLQSGTDPRQLSPVSLAFVGDAVFELLVRERMLSHGSMPANKLHSMTVKKVCASSQAKAFAALEAALTDDESDILRRGRNANTSRIPKSCTPEEYRKATAIEALFGYLYLAGSLERIAALFSIIDSQITEVSTDGKQKNL